MRTIDLNERRKARGDIQVTAGDGQVFTLPSHYPVEAVMASLKLTLAREDPAGALAGIYELYAALFGKDADNARKAIALSEVNTIIEEAYGITPGEVPASPAS